jgi:hypothetical protein
MEKSGGMYGFTQDIAVFATSARSGQACAFAVGCFIFFDDYAVIYQPPQASHTPTSSSPSSYLP